MLVQSNVAKVAMQGKKAMNVGVDMGSGCWVATVVEYDTGREHCHNFRGPHYDSDCFELVKASVDAGYDVHVCYEAGRCGFTPARAFSSHCGASVTVLPVGKLELVFSGKRVKTDRIDSRFLAGLDPRCMELPSVWVPSVEQECRRGALREKKRIEKDIKRNNNRILAILERWPVVDRDRTHLGATAWTARLAELRASSAVPELELQRIELMVRELEALERNLAEWSERLERLEKEEREAAQAIGEVTVIDVLRQYTGVGDEIARAVSWYIGDLRRFRNGRKFGSYLGLTPTPFSSSGKNRDQGISKAGSPELRRLAVQLAWLWLQWQPESALAQKWAPRLGKGKNKGERGRSRKSAIVALARQLMVALWRAAVKGVPLEGAVKNRPSVRCDKALSGAREPVSHLGERRLP